MKLTETKLRSIIREELSRISENNTIASTKVQKAIDKLGLDLQRNNPDRETGEMEFVNRSDDMGFFVRKDGQSLEIIGRGRRRNEGGTVVRDFTDVRAIANAIEEEPLGETRVEPAPGRGQAPRRY